MRNTRIAGYLAASGALALSRTTEELVASIEQRNDFFDELETQIARNVALGVDLSLGAQDTLALQASIEQFEQYGELLRAGTASGTHSREVVALITMGSESYKRHNGLDIVVPSLESFGETELRDVYEQLTVSNEGLLEMLKGAARKVSSGWSKATIEMNKTDNTKFVNKVKNIADNLKKDLAAKKFDESVTIDIGKFATDLAQAGAFPKDIPGALTKDVASLSYIFGKYGHYSKAYWEALYKQWQKAMDLATSDGVDEIYKTIGSIMVPQTQVSKEIYEGKGFIQNCELVLSHSTWAGIAKSGSDEYFDAVLFPPYIEFKSVGEATGAPETLEFSKADVAKLIDSLKGYQEVITESNAMWADTQRAILQTMSIDGKSHQVKDDNVRRLTTRMSSMLFGNLNTTSKFQTAAQVHCLTSVKIVTRLIETILGKVKNGKSKDDAAE